MIFKTIKEIEIDDYTLLKKGLYVDMELSQIRQILSFININLPDKNQKRNILVFEQHDHKDNDGLINGKQQYGT